jgi:uncharacterized protein (DUF305 family)
MKKNRTAALAAAPLALALLLAGCTNAGTTATSGSNDSDETARSSTPSVEVQGEYNAADTMFASMMIPHHEQAVEMSDMLLAKDDVDERVAELAERIKAAQAPEIEQMEGWLDDWGMPSGAEMGDMRHGDGMMSEDDMAALEAATGNDASRLFLAQMIQHHEGAVDMAEAEIADGINPDAVALAETIVETQAAEITEMRDLLADF